MFAGFFVAEILMKGNVKCSYQVLMSMQRHIETVLKQNQ